MRLWQKEEREGEEEGQREIKRDGDARNLLSSEHFQIARVEVNLFNRGLEFPRNKTMVQKYLRGQRGEVAPPKEEDDG